MISDHSPKLHYHSFKNAWNGLFQALKTQRNLRLEVLIGSVAIIAALLLGFSEAKLMVVTATVLLVIGFEMINTSVEAMVDSVHIEHNQLAKTSKDVAAGAVLVVTILAGIVGLYLYLPPLLDLLY